MSERSDTGGAIGYSISGTDLASGNGYVNKHLSVSRLSLYESCARAFFFRYVAKAEGLPFGDAPAFGVILHAALEAFFQWVVDEEFSGPLPVDRLVAEYKKAWVVEEGRDGNEKLRGTVGIGMYQEGLQILRTYAASHPPIDHLSILAVEQEFNIRVGDFMVNGFMDRVDKISDDHVQVVDYKSNRKMYTREELAVDLQMGAYGLAIRSLYPWAKRVTFVFHMLRFDARQESVQSAQTIDDVAGYIDAIGKRTERDTEWKPRLNENCGYCEFRLLCDSYQAAVSGELKIPTISKDDDIDSLLRARDLVGKFANLAYARKKEIDTILKRRIAETGPFDAGGFHARLIPMFDTVYPRVATVEEFVKLRRSKAGPEISNETLRSQVENRILVVDGVKVKELRDEIAKEETDAKAQLVKVRIDALGEKTPATPKIDVRADKNAKSVAALAKAGKNIIP